MRTYLSIALRLPFKVCLHSALLLSLFLSAGPSLYARDIRIAVPAWLQEIPGRSLDRASDELRRRSANRLRLIFVPYSFDVSPPLQLMGAGDVQGALLLPSDLNSVQPQWSLLEWPGLFKSESELRKVLAKEWPGMNRDLGSRNLWASEAFLPGPAYVVSTNRITAKTDFNGRGCVVPGMRSTEFFSGNGRGVPLLNLEAVHANLLARKIQFCIARASDIQRLRWMDAGIRFLVKEPVSYGHATFVVSLANLEALSEEDKASLQDVLNALANNLDRLSGKYESLTLKRLMEKGLQDDSQEAIGIVELRNQALMRWKLAQKDGASLKKWMKKVDAVRSGRSSK